MSSALKEKIIERMGAKNLSIAELERRAGLSIHSVRNIIKGRIKKPSAQSLQAIAKALECSIVDLINNASPVNEDISQEKKRITKKSLPLDYPELMEECAQKVLYLLIEGQYTVEIDECLEVIKKVYCYSSRAEPRKLDTRFAEWLIETQFQSHKLSSKD